MSSIQKNQTIYTSKYNRWLIAEPGSANEKAPFIVEPLDYLKINREVKISGV